MLSQLDVNGREVALKTDHRLDWDSMKDQTKYKSEDSKVWDPGKDPNKYLPMLIASSQAVASDDEDYDMLINNTHRTELDSHANMVVVGINAVILNTTGKMAQVKLFSPEYEALQEVPIVDIAMRYDCPNTDVQYIVVMRNVLSVPALDSNLYLLSSCKKQASK